LDAVTDVVFISNTKVRISMDRHISVADLQDAIGFLQDYQLSDRPWGVLAPIFAGLQTYRWLLLVLLLIVVFTLLDVLWWRWLAGMDMMLSFMGWWFVIFSFLKFYNLRGFVDGFVSYDIVAAHWRLYGWIYPFLELALALFFLSWVYVLGASVVTVLIMSIGTVWVWHALGHKIQCVCIGTFFSLPLTKVTIAENVFMILMAALMIYFHL
jgi:hypothetical protein